MKFVVGDVVRCIDDGSFHHLQIGELYTVVNHPKEDGVYLWVKRMANGQTEGGFFPSRFELFERTVTENLAKEYEEIMAAQEIMKNA